MVKELLILSILTLASSIRLPVQPDAMGCMPSRDPLADCYGAFYTPTAGELQFRAQGCNTHVDCYHMSRPPQWCKLAYNQRWAKEGCHCDPKRRMCIIDRITSTPRGQFMEYAICYPTLSWYCAN